MSFPYIASVNESQTFSNISATAVAFQLAGGTYGVTVMATWGGGSVTLQTLGPDRSTLITVLTAFTANGYGYVSLPPGQYQLTIATATAVYATIARIN